jgi:hypothetical protein
VSGLAWIVPFGVVAFSPLRGDTNSFDALFLGLRSRIASERRAELSPTLGDGRGQAAAA